MESIPNRRAIVDRKALIVAFDELLGDSDPLSEPVRRGALELVQRALEHGRAEVRRRLHDEATGTEIAHANCFLIDQILRVLYDFAAGRVYPVTNPTAGERLGMVAVGGYGRGEMAPHSDVDLLFLLPYKQTPWGEQVVEYLLYMLWDAGLKVGHATRSVDECIRLSRADITIRTAILEARYLWGDEGLYKELRQRFQDEVVAGTGPDFVEAKLAERDVRHQRVGNSRYLLEPNVKDGKGGLRDLHTLFWIGKYLYQVSEVSELVERGVLTQAEWRRFAKAEDFLWTVRCHLHDLAERAEERLTFDVQSEIGRRLGYTDRAGLSGVERFMKHYFLMAKVVGDLTRIFCAALEEQHKRKPRFDLRRLAWGRREVDGFRIEGERLTVASDDAFSSEPVRLLRLFEVAPDDPQPQAHRSRFPR
jgi:[protein-PII] uridylyltransferase